MLAEITAGSVYPREEGDFDKGFARGVRLRTYQKQTLGFMLDRERSAEAAAIGTTFVRPERLDCLLPTGVRGGYIADEVGMGKTLCALGVVLAHPAPGGDTTPMLADGNRITVWYADEEEAEHAPGVTFGQVGVVLWSNHEGMRVRFDKPSSEDERELWVDAAEDDWAWGDLVPPHVPRRLLADTQEDTLPHRVHGWIRECKKTFAKLQAYSHQVILLKATLVIAPVSLLGQWADEIEDFAPGLSVVTWHSCAHKGRSMPSATDVLARFSRADIVLTTAGMAAKLLGYRFHRIIVDEVHTEDVRNGFLFHRSDTRGVPGSAPIPPRQRVQDHGNRVYRPGVPAPSIFRSTGRANYEVSAPYVWLLTGTPLTRGVEDLFLGAHLLGHADFGLRLHGATVGPQLLDSMRTFCIRHRKVQVIKGEAALSLPKSETRVVWLTMTPTERLLYDTAVAKDYEHNVDKIEREGAKDFVLEMTLRCRRQACSNIYKFSGQERAFTESEALLMYNKTKRRGTEWTFDWKPKLEECTKLRALLTDLTELRIMEPECMAIVFTHHRETHAAVVELLREEDDLQVFEIHGAMDTNKRHAAIREFQWRGKAQRGAKVLVVTIRVGAVGMTLAAASRVYLFEPAFNPAAEAQAAGRIHRLGQTRDVLITRFVYRNSIEENIVRMHDAIAAGRVQMADGQVPANGVRILTGGGDTEGDGIAR